MRVVQFNLLPYRNAWMKRRQRQLLVQVGALLTLTVLVVVGVSSDLNSRIEEKMFFQNRLQEVEQAIQSKSLEAAELQKKRDELLQLAEQLRDSSELSVHQGLFFNELAQFKPSSTAIHSLRTQANELIVEGSTSDISRLSLWVEGLDLGSEFLDSFALEVIEQPSGQGADKLTGAHRFTARGALNPALGVKIESQEEGEGQETQGGGGARN